MTPITKRLTHEYPELMILQIILFACFIVKIFFLFITMLSSMKLAFYIINIFK